MSAAEKRSYYTTLQHCEARIAQPFAVLNGSRGVAAALANQWGSIYLSVTASRPVQNAGRKAQACARAAGFVFEPLHGDYMLGAMEYAFTHPGRKTQPQLADILVRCLTPLDNVRGQLLANRRVQFFKAHALAIQQIRTEANEILDKIIEAHPAVWRQAQ